MKTSRRIRRCSLKPYHHPQPEEGASILAGSLDKPTGTRLTGHIFVADKGDYYDITDGLPQFAAFPPDQKG